MKKILSGVLFLLLLSSISNSNEYAGKLDELMNKYDKVGLFSGVVLLAKDGVSLFEKSYGYADWENKIPVTTSTLFNIASINKMFTQSMINQLEKEGKLNKSDNLGKYIKLYNDERDDKITIAMLIEMKAGLNDYTRNPEFNENLERFKTVNDFLEIIKDEPLLFEPGTGQEYSNSGYVVLGAIIEKVTGKPYPENLKERFFIPLGMKDSYYRQIGDVIKGTAAGTFINYDGTKRSQPFHYMPSPAGGIFMSIGDLLKFDNELRSTKIMGLGIRAGGTEAWNSIVAQYDDGYSLLILSNFAHAAEEVEMRFSKILKGESYPEPRISLDMTFYAILTKKGADELGSQLKSLVEENDMEYRPFHLNMFGYSLMGNGKIDLALEVFLLNTRLFPDFPNVWDSLAEAYMNKGDNEKAISLYKKVLDMQPDNPNAKKMLEKLQKK
ncbi:MAG: serine hydrolase [Ignavibacteria bacterium]|nr:serine hydrolase [Ignavibacteria bacterium]